MITANKITKRFGEFKALSELSCEIPSGCVYGLVGSNGAGKSTFMRLICGIYRPDAGSVSIDGEPVYNSPSVKSRLAFVPDELWFLPGANMRRMAETYAAAYTRFSHARFEELTAAFGLDPNAPLNTFSKGMRRQAAIILALSSMPDYVLFDETFDGLDPIMRALVKRVVYSDVESRGMTAVVSSHSLRDLEDTCDRLVLLHRGGIVFESDIQNIKTTLFKVQLAFSEDYGKEVFNGIELLNFSKKGSVANAIVRGEREAVRAALAAKKPLLLEILPLSLEEVFVYEMEALGYSFDDVLKEEETNGKNGKAE